MNKYCVALTALLPLTLLTPCMQAYTEYSGTMTDYMGINIHTALWKDFYHPNASPQYEHVNVGRAFKWVRHYHRWDKFEPTNDDYRWMSLDGGMSFYFDEYFRKLNEDGINIVAVPMNPPDWLNASIQFPNDNGTGEFSNNYRQRIEFMTQMAARYGPTGGHSESRLETVDKLQGLDYIRYFEDHNEPNQDWRDDIWPGAYYGQYQNGFFDGRGVTRDGGLPLAGIKHGDPAVFHVGGGLNNNGVDDSYLDQMLLSAGRQAFDIINIHTYFRNTHLFPANTWPWPPEAKGTSPEYYIVESGLEEIQKTIEWRDRNLPGTPIWITEFGWDTYETPDGIHSTNYAPELNQANYIMRTFPLFKKLGIDKAFLYFDFDPNSRSAKMFSSSGIFGDRSNGRDAKIAYFYMTAMADAIGDYYYDGAHIYGEGTPEVYVYSFSKSDTEVALMLWCRERDTLFDNGTTIDNYTLSIPFAETCRFIAPTDEVVGGVVSNATVAQAGTASATVTIPVVSETPLFIQLTGTQNIRPNLAPEVNAGKDFEIQLPQTSAAITCEASDLDGGTVDTYLWTQLEGPSGINIQNSDTDTVQLSGLPLGNYRFQVEVTDNDGALVRDVVEFAVTEREPYTSDSQPHAIPGLIEAEDFDLGGQGVAYHDTTEGNSKNKDRLDEDVDIQNVAGEEGNFYIADAVGGEWLEYSVSIAETGLYSMNIRMSAFNDRRRMKVLMDGLDVSGMIQVEGTGDWNVYTENIAEPVRLTAGDHIMRVYFDTSGISFDRIDIQPYTGEVTSGGSFFRLSTAQTNWQSLRIFYENKKTDEEDVLAGGNDHLEFYLTDLSADLSTNWSKIKIALRDTSNNLKEIRVGDYEQNIGANWTLVTVPLSVFADAGVDLEHLRNFDIRSGSAGPFDIGIDEVRFVGGSSPFLWMGEAHSDNPLSNSQIILTLEEIGGLGGADEYNEAPYVDAGPDVTIRPLLNSYTFNCVANDIDGDVVGYEWIQVDGPDVLDSSGLDTADLSVTLDTFGTYTFRVFVTDDLGNTTEDDVVLVYEDTGGYLSIDHTVYDRSSFSIFYDVEKEPLDVVNGANDLLTFFVKRFDLTSNVDWDQLRIVLKDGNSPEGSASINVGNYETLIDGQWVQVSIPLSDFSAVDLTNLRKITIDSVRAGPYLRLGVDEFVFSGGIHPLTWYGDSHPEIELSSIPSSMSVENTSAEGVVAD